MALILIESGQSKCLMTSNIFDSLQVTQQLPRFVLIRSVHTFNAVMTQAMWAILQHLYQSLKSC